jgi:hypothetical protein
MAKYFGKIGFAELVETAPDVWTEQITERSYYGDILQDYRKLENSGDVNDDITVTNKISILADPYATERIQSMRYIWYLGVKWKVSHVDVQYPRLVINIGGEYHGEEESGSEQGSTGDPW